MSLCGAFITLALNATLLGDSSLEVMAAHETPLSDCSARNESTTPNAVLSLKDAKGNTVFSQKIRIADFDFYLSETPANSAAETQRGGVPARETTVFVTYPRTTVTAKAKTVELAMIDASFRQSARLPVSIEGLK
jgi:hypothetical protein